MPSLSRLLFFTSFLLFVSCSSRMEQNNESSAIPDSAAVAAEAEETGVTGDFDGDGVMEKVLTRVLSDPDFNPEEPLSYSIEFSNTKLTSIEVNPMIGDGFMVLNEGNIDGKPGDELSILTCYSNDMADFDIYTYSDRKWNPIAEPINVSCRMPDNIDWEDVVTNTDSGVYAIELQQLTDDSTAFQRRKLMLSSGQGDFDGNGQSENVYIKTIHDAGLDDSGYWEYSIIFSDKKIPALIITNETASGCEVENSGNVDGRPGEELTITQFGMMNQVFLELYSFNGKTWERLSTEVLSR
jgi:hypothetical protein